MTPESVRQIPGKNLFIYLQNVEETIQNVWFAGKLMLTANQILESVKL